MIRHEEKIEILGETHQVIYSNNHFLKARVIKEGASLIVHLSEIKKEKHYSVLVNWLRNKSRKEIEERVGRFSSLHDFEFNKISIRDQRSRWGSCSSRKNLNFNWRLIFVPSAVMDYVIIHELAHTKEMNHSKKFWAIVGSIDPGYKNHKLYLKKVQSNLLAI